MQAYLISLFVAALVGTLIGILSPEGGMSKHVRLVTALILICILISPIQELIETLRDFATGGIELPSGSDSDSEEYLEQLGSATDAASKSYFVQMLTETLEQQFSMPTGTVRCHVEWAQTEGSLSPTRVTVILSGNSIWKNPHEIQEFVQELLECECVTAIE